MRRAHWRLVGLVGLLALAAGITAKAQVPARKGPLGTLKGDVAKGAKEKEETVEKVFKALGPAIAEQLRAGRTAELPGVGTFQVVRVTEYQDLVNGLVTTIPARSYVEFVPTAELNNAANAPGAVPARIIYGYKFVIETGRVPPFKAPELKTSRWVVP